jgi:hypothetical protein
MGGVEQWKAIISRTASGNFIHISYYRDLPISPRLTVGWTSAFRLRIKDLSNVNP